MINFKYLLLLIILTVSPDIFSQPVWPVKRNIDLSSGFGDFRQNRFHAGIDIRTGGKEGEPVFAPTDGWLYRIKMSYIGYGKGLYIKDNEGHIYVFGHLKDFSDKIDKIVKQHQLKIQRYYFDHYYLKDSIFIKQGELIAYSGQTGTGAPHLHFEIRKGENLPINPLIHGFKIIDNVKPVFNKLIFKMLDDYSLFENGKRELVVDVINNGNGNYNIDSTLSFKNKVGIIVDLFDQMRIGGMKQTVNSLSLLIDGVTIYEVIHDTLDFQEMRSANLEFDYIRAVGDNQKTFRRLYKMIGNNYRGSYSLNSSNGILDPSRLSGKHNGEIIAVDSHGNQAKLKFDFEFLPEKQTENKADNNINYPDSMFEQTNISYHIIDEGLWITASGENIGNLDSEIRLYADDKLLWIEKPLTVDNNKTACFISPQNKYSKIDKIEYVVNQGSNNYIKSFQNLSIFTIGIYDNTKISIFNMNLVFNKENLYKPRFIELKHVDDVYEILPESFLCKNRFNLFFKLDTTSDDLRKNGLYWLNKKKNEWIWIDNKIVGDTLYSFSEGGGQMVILRDTIAPSIRNLSISNLKTYFTSLPKISFILEDDFSWIEDDRNFSVTINDEWLIPEYDMEQKLFQTKPNHPLKDGKHKLEMHITDRVGNKFEQTVEFYVKGKQNNNKGN